MHRLNLQTPINVVGLGQVVDICVVVIDALRGGPKSIRQGLLSAGVSAPVSALRRSERIAALGYATHLGGATGTHGTAAMRMRPAFANR